MTTVESISSTIHTKISKLITICDEVVVLLGPKFGNYLSTCKNDLAKILGEFNLNSVESLLGYYSGYNDLCGYTQVLSRENYDMKIQSVSSGIISFIMHAYDTGNLKTKIKDSLDELIRSIELVSEMELFASTSVVKYDVCDVCSIKMDLIEEISEYQCPSCGQCVHIGGAVFRNDQIYTQEGMKTRATSNITQRHYRFWMDRIQGIEAKEFDSEKIAAIEAVIARDKIYKQDLNCELMRKILADPAVNMTSWNDHSTKLIKVVGGPEAPTLDYDEDRKISIKFDKAVQLYAQAAPSGTQYKSYYPDLIRRIIEVDFKDNKEKLRLVKFIHIQQRKTTIKNDHIFKKICELAGPESGLVYTPTDTDRSKYN
jgi:predicted RNA-binding Zn-ribbon protein involved in translation (DUF1610 family)